MKNSRLLSGALALLAIFCVFGAPASATVLPQGTVAPPDVFGSLAGSLLAKTTLTVPAPGGTVSYTAEVVKGTDATAVCPAGGCLDFIVQVSSSPTTVFCCTVRESDFTGFLTDVGYIPPTGTAGDLTSPAGGTPPTEVNRGPPGNAIFFTGPGFTPIPITPGSTSDILVIETDALNFTAGEISVIDGGGFFPSFAPAAVPEPASLALFVISLAALGCSGFIRRFIL